jgi:Protein  of unknown function (DUF3018)
MNKVSLIELWEREENEPFQGWNFSHLEGRVLQENPPWDYVATAQARVADVHSPSFRAAACRQSKAIAGSAHAKADQAFIDSVSAFWGLR